MKGAKSRVVEVWECLLEGQCSSLSPVVSVSLILRASALLGEAGGNLGVSISPVLTYQNQSKTQITAALVREDVGPLLFRVVVTELWAYCGYCPGSIQWQTHRLCVDSFRNTLLHKYVLITSRCSLCTVDHGLWGAWLLCGAVPAWARGWEWVSLCGYL